MANPLTDPVQAQQDYVQAAKEAAAAYLENKKAALFKAVANNDTARSIANEQLPQLQAMGLAPMGAHAIDAPPPASPTMVPATAGTAEPTATLRPPVAASPSMMGEQSQSSSGGSSVTHGVQLSPEVEARSRLAADDTKQGNQLAAATEIQGRRDQEDQAKRAGIYSGAQGVEENVARMPEDHMLAQQAQKVADVVGEYSNAHVDARHFAKNTNLGQKLAWALAMAAGGFAAGLKGGTNSAAELWQKAVDNDITAQQDNIHLLGTKATQERGLLGDMQAKFKDAREQRLAARVAALTAFKTKIATQYDSTADAQVKANLLKENAKAEELLSKDLKDIQTTQADKVEQHSTSTSGTTVRPDNKQQSLDAEALRDYSHQMATMDVPGTEAQVQATIASVPKDGKGTGLVADKLWQHSPAVFKATYGDGAVAYQQNIAALRDKFYNLISGAAISPAEEQRYKQEFDGAGDLNSKLRTVQRVADVARAKQAAASGAITPEQKAQYDYNAATNAQAAQRVAPAGLPSFAIPAGSK